MNKYAKYSPEELENHLSNYLLSSWSYSAVSCFARNEKAFEMQYIYGERDRSRVSAVAGNAYHAALKDYFSNWQQDKQPDYASLTQAAYEYLDEIPANEWLLTDKIPSVQQARDEATRLVNILVKSFCEESVLYTDMMDSVVAVEVKADAWVTVNGVDIPLPLHGVIDLVVRLKDGRIVIIDHKSKSAYTGEDEVALTHGQQGISYVLLWEAFNNAFGEVSEVWFIENKTSRNKDGSPQLRKHTFVMDNDNRRLFEALLYEPLRRMLEAVADPDYIYTINTYDNLTDMARLYDFWARTQLSEIADFRYVPSEKVDMLAKRLRKIKDSSVGSIAPNIITSFRRNAASFITLDYSHTDMQNNEKIEHVLRTFNIKIQVAHIIEGFSCDTYLCEVAPGTELLSLFRHTLDIANALDVPIVRLQGQPLVMYEGKSYLAIEVNKGRPSEPLMWDAKYTVGHKLALGLDNFRNTVVWDLDNNATPHALVCGATGSGKSVLLSCILYDAIHVGIDDITILDPKFEYAYMELPSFVKVRSDIYDIENALADMVADMEQRIRTRTKRLSLVIFDEFADVADQARGPKELASGERPMLTNFKMLLQKGRSAGFRFVAATQRASTKTIPGDIKVNLPVQICFLVPKGLDSKVVLDTEGAETLAGHGDGLIHSPQYKDGLVRFQGFYHE